MNLIAVLFATIALLPSFAQADSDNARELGFCTLEQTESHDEYRSFRIFELGEGMILPPGLYFQFHNSPSRGLSLFRVRAGEASLRDLLSQMTVIKQQHSQGDYSGQLSFTNLRVSAAAISATTTASDRADTVLLFEGNDLRIGDSHMSEDDFGIGKYMHADVGNCY